jgi:hypothetical protein
MSEEKMLFYITIGYIASQKCANQRFTPVEIQSILEGSNELRSYIIKITSKNWVNTVISVAKMICGAASEVCPVIDQLPS